MVKIASLTIVGMFPFKELNNVNSATRRFVFGRHHNKNLSSLPPMLRQNKLARLSQTFFGTKQSKVGSKIKRQP